MNIFTKHSPTLFIVAGVIGMGATAYMAYKYSPKVRLVIEDEEAEAEETGKKYGVIDKGVTVFKTMWPVLAIGFLSACSILWGGYSHTKNTVRTMFTLAATEKRLSDYQASTLEEVGVEAERKIRQRLSEKRYSDCDNDGQVLIATGSHDEQLFFDVVTGRQFYCTMNKIDAGINEVNRRLMDSDFVSLNDLYDEWDVSHFGEDFGEYNGWDYHFDGSLIVDKFPKIEDGKAVICLDYKIFPHYHRR